LGGAFAIVGPRRPGRAGAAQTARRRRGGAVTEAPLLETRDALLARAQLFAAAEPSFARFLAATTLATDPEDLAASSPAVLEALWRQSYDRLGRRDPEPHKVFFAPPADRGHPEVIEVFSA